MLTAAKWSTLLYSFMLISLWCAIFYFKSEMSCSYILILLSYIYVAVFSSIGSIKFEHLRSYSFLYSSIFSQDCILCFKRSISLFNRRISANFSYKILFSLSISFEIILKFDSLSDIWFFSSFILRRPSF